MDLFCVFVLFSLILVKLKLFRNPFFKAAATLASCCFSKYIIFEIENINQSIIRRPLSISQWGNLQQTLLRGGSDVVERRLFSS